MKLKTKNKKKGKEKTNKKVVQQPAVFVSKIASPVTASPDTRCCGDKARSNLSTGLFRRTAVLLAMTGKKFFAMIKQAAQKEITLFTKSNHPFAFKPFLLTQAVIVFCAVLFCLATFGNIFIINPSNAVKLQAYKTQIIQTVATKQLTPIVVEGRPVKWISVVKRADLTENQRFLELPKTARNIKVQIITKQQAIVVLSAQKPLAQLTATDRKQLAGIFNLDLAGINFRSTNTAGLAELKELVFRILSSINNFFLAGVEKAAKDAIDQVVEALTQEEIITAEDVKLVDLSKQELKQEEKEEKKQENEEQKEEKKEEKEFKKDDEIALPSSADPDRNDEVGDTASDNSSLTRESEATDEATSEPITETQIEETPSDQAVIDTISNDSIAVEEVLGEEPNVESIEADLLETVSSLSDQTVIDTISNDSVAEENGEYVQVEYETPAPTITEQATDTGKLVTVSSLDEVASTPDVDLIAAPVYTDVVAFTTIPEIYKVGQESNIKLKWKNNGDQNVAFTAHDLNNNGKLDYIEWVVPHLSDQIFEIIFISKAFELDENKEIINDIYDLTVNKDDVWANIASSHYVRATFNEILDNTKDITLYVKPTGSVPVQVEVYPVYTDAEGNQIEGAQLNLVADGVNPDFSNIDSEGTYRVLLANLAMPTDTFDLKVIGSTSGVDLDWIVDPAKTVYWVAGTGSWSDATNHWAASSGGSPDAANAPVSGDSVVFDANSGTGTVTIDSATISVVNFNTTGVGALDFTINAGVSFTSTGTVTIISGRTITNNGTATITSLGAGTGAWTQGTNSTLNYTGTSITPTLTASASGNTVNYNANANTTVVATTYYNLGVAVGATLTANRQYRLAGSTTVTNICTIGQTANAYIAYLDPGWGAHYTLTLSGTDASTSSTPLVLNSYNGTPTGAMNPDNGGYVSYTGDGATTITAGSYYLLWIGNATTQSAGQIYTLAGDITVNSTLTIGPSSGTNTQTLSALGYTITLRRTNSSGLVVNTMGSFNAGTSTVKLTRDANQPIPSATFYNLEVGTGSLTANRTYTLPDSGNVTVTNLLTVGPASGNNTATLAWTTNYTLTLSSAGTPLLLGTNGVINITNGTVSYTGNGATTIAPGTYFKLQAGNAASLNINTYTLGGNTTVASVLTVGYTSGNTETLADGGYNLTLSGTGTPFVLNSSGAFSPTGTVTYTGTTTATNVKGTTYNNLTLTPTGATTYTLSADTTCSGNLTINANATLDTKNGSNYALNVAGNFTNSGAFTARLGIVTLTTGTHTFTGATTFYNLTINANNIVTFPASTTQTISNAFSCAGTTGNIITINSSSPGTQATLSMASGTVNCDYLSLTDSAATGGATWHAGSHSTGSNYSGWLDLNTAPTLTSVSDSPDPIKGGSTITITPTGQGDGESNALYYYCNESGTPTSANTLCSEANTSYSSPYSSMTCTYSVTTGDATRTVYCRTYDGTDYSTERTATYLVDTTAPAGGSVSYTDGFFTTTSIPVTYATGTDNGSGLNNSSGKIQRAEATLSAGSCGTFSDFSDLHTGYNDSPYSDTTVAAEKCYMYKYLIQDAVANQATYASANVAKIDTTAPTTSDDFANNDTWQASNQTITLTPADSGGSGIAWTKYCSDADNTCDPASGTAYTDPVSVASEGVSYFRYASQDNAGNTQTTVSKIVKIDTTGPITIASSVRDNNTITSTLSCADTSGSGCALTYYCIDGDDVCAPNILYISPVTYSVTSSKYFRFYSVDFVANIGATNADRIDWQGGGGSGYAPSAPAQEAPSVNETPAPVVETLPPTPNIIDQLTQQFNNFQQQAQNIVSLLNPKPSTPSPEIIYPPIAESVPQEAPLPLQGWNIMEVKPVSQFSLTPINSDVSFFADKIPQFKQTLTAFGIDIENLSDVQKVSGAELYLPGLTKAVLTKAEILETNKFSAMQGVPLADLSPEAKQKIPTDIVFVRSGGELIDYSMAISVDKAGAVQQKINTISGKTMELVIKPESEAKRVTGFIALKKAAIGQEQTKVLGYITRLLTASVISSFEPLAQKVSRENLLLVNKFEYDEVSPGMYKASVSAPLAEGEYEINTVIEYKDINLAPKETKMTAIVNPEGYVYSQLPDGRLRIKNASVLLYWLNSATNNYEIWPADKFLQKNPVLTDETGKYSFLVPEGTYKLQVKSANYATFESEPFAMKEDIAVNMDIELHKKFSWFGWLNWQVVITALLVILIGYNIFQNNSFQKMMSKIFKRSKKEKINPVK